jgi:hypothetical protein
MNVVRIDERGPVRADTISGSEAAPTPGERVCLLMQEARSAGIEHLEALREAIGVVRDLSLDVARGGDAYGPGVRDLAARLAEDLLWRSKNLEAFTARERAGLVAH